MRYFVLLCCVLVWSCNPKANGSRQGPPIQLRVEHLKGEDAWVVRYRLPEPVTAVRFITNIHLFRKGAWEVGPSDLSITHEDGYEVIRAAHGVPFDAFDVRFSSRYGQLEKEYALNFSFTDGGTLLYTGHLDVAVEYKGQFVEPGLELTFMPAVDEHMVWNGRVFRKSFTATTHDLDFGTYVYFGQQGPLQSPHMLAIIDGGVPGWMRRKLNTHLPKLFAYYTEQTGIALAQKPAVYFSFDPGTKHTWNYAGGTLPGLIQLSVQGQGWREEAEEPLAEFLIFVAHEAAHLWNSQLVRHEEGQAAWMHEGGADAFALRSLYALGVLDETGLYDRYSDALDECVDGLRNSRLIIARELGKSRNFYHCGSTIGLITESAIQQKHPDLDLFDFWERLMEKGQANGNRYTQAHYYETLDEMTGAGVTSGIIRSLINDLQTNPKTTFRQALIHVGRVVGEESGSLKVRP